MRLVDKWLCISELRKILGANGAEDYKNFIEYQWVSGQHGRRYTRYARYDREVSLGMTGAMLG